MIAFRARLVFPVDGPPIKGGVVAIDHDRIVAVGARDSSDVRDLGNVAILPGLVNAHTHLEFSDLRQPLGEPGIALPAWIRLVVAERRARGPTDGGIEQGIAESTREGVTALGDISSRNGRRESGALEITEFCETLGLRRETIESRRREAIDAVSDRNRWSETLRPALSPHSPYTVHPELLAGLVALSAAHCVPVAHHLAESREELWLLAEGNGPFRDLLKDLKAWDTEAIPRGSRPLDYLRMLASAHRALVIHGNYLDEEEIALLAARRERMSVVYCPRTHSFFRHEPYPLSKMLARGVRVAIATDSRASAPDLSPLAEMRWAAGLHPDISPEALLRMITASAAEALGRSDEIGDLCAGKLADLAIVALPEHDAADPHELLVDPVSRVVATIFRGRAVHGRHLVKAGNS